MLCFYTVYLDDRALRLCARTIRYILESKNKLLPHRTRFHYPKNEYKWCDQDVQFLLKYKWYERL